ncbi:MAG TPA: hypothetical protein VFH26_07785 [Gemmatimonadales bacterium]|nr:hypothetical protein [Gemmatimonadales bacterium]
MCYFLYLGSPLTLSEVRSMLPPGLTCDLASRAGHETVKAMHPDAVTVARILAGRCSCDLIRARLSDSKEDERHLRERYRRLGLSRSAMIEALERHRGPATPRTRKSEAGGELSRFVAEHARNAGPSLYYLHFSSDSDPPSPLGSIRRVSSAMVTASAGNWLEEGTPTLIIR